MIDTKELAERVRRLREQSTGVYPNVLPIDEKEAMQTINDLVQLVGEMRPYLINGKDVIIATGKLRYAGEHHLQAFKRLEQTLTKSSPIAELAKGEL